MHIMTLLKVSNKSTWMKWNKKCSYVFIVDPEHVLACLTYSRLLLHFYTLRKRQKTRGFLMFSGYIYIVLQSLVIACSCNLLEVTWKLTHFEAKLGKIGETMVNGKQKNIYLQLIVWPYQHAPTSTVFSNSTSESECTKFQCNEKRWQ